MTLIELALLGCGLAVDSSLVALAQGLTAREHRFGRAALLAGTFAGFHGVMIVAGWFAGASTADWFGSVDHWVAFVLLALIGLKTIREASATPEGERGELPASRLVLAGLATSLDALAVGFGLALVAAAIVPTVLLTTAIIGVTTIFAYYGGRGLGQRWERGAHWIAGLVLIGIGVRILLGHLAAAPGA
jgi:putative Mn2+ efflux pump MntP